MTVTLILVVCLLSQPDVCREERGQMVEGDITGCAVLGQQIAAQWTEDHPKYRVIGFKCQVGKKGQPI